MAINGIETVIWSTPDTDKAVTFFQDFGLPLYKTTEKTAHFLLEEGSHLIIKDSSDASLRDTCLVGAGVRDVIWGVDNQQSLDDLVAGLRADRQVDIDASGTARFFSDAGLAYGLRVFNRKAVVNAPDAVNAAGNIKRLNQSRKWRRQARPKTMNHVVFLLSPSAVEKEIAFMVERLNFRITDVQDGVGTYIRADGTFEHHSLLIGSTELMGANVPPMFNHVAFGVEDIDELMTGNNLMVRKGWDSGFLGVGRHRIASALHSYWKVPGGAGEAEFSADTDYVDDNWQPRRWGRFFGQFLWSATLDNFPAEEPEWESEYLGDISIDPASIKH